MSFASRASKAGMIKVRVFRPFPGAELAAALENAKGIAIMDRAESFSGCGGPLGSELKAALLRCKERINNRQLFLRSCRKRLHSKNSLRYLSGSESIIVSGKQEAEQFKYIGLRK